MEGRETSTGKVEANQMCLRLCAVHRYYRFLHPSSYFSLLFLITSAFLPQFYLQGCEGKGANTNIRLLLLGQSVPADGTFASFAIKPLTSNSEYLGEFPRVHGSSIADNNPRVMSSACLPTHAANGTLSDPTF
eukprot:g81536.t1